MGEIGSFAITKTMFENAVRILVCSAVIREKLLAMSAHGFLVLCETDPTVYSYVTKYGRSRTRLLTGRGKLSQRF
jgi:hypothetical protein